MATIFLEANPFGSRLHVLSALIRAALTKGDVDIVMRRRVDDKHFSEWIASLPSEVRITVTERTERRTHSGGTGPWEAFKLFLSALRLSKRGDTICFTALDDYMSSIAWLTPILLLSRRRGLGFVFVKYRVGGLQGVERPKEFLLAILIRALRQSSRGTLAVFDERIQERSWLVVWPDPWSGDFGQRSRREARLAVGLSQHSRVVGMIGYQDKRKGFDIATGALRRLSERRSDFEVLVLGRVDGELSECELRLREDVGSRLLHVQRFVTDGELPDYFAACDLVLLPYRPEFTSTSGVLVRAAASGVPVIVSDGGLVAYRVRRHQLGVVVGAWGMGAWADAIDQKLDDVTEHDRSLSMTWAAASHESVFVSVAAEVF